MYNTLAYVNKKLENLENTVVPNCFRKAGFQLKENDDASGEVDEDDIPLSELRALMAQSGFDDLTPEEFVHLDDAVFTENDTEFSTKDDESKTNPNDDDSEKENDEEDNNCEQIESQIVSTIKHTEALDMLNEIKLFAYSKENAFLLDKIVECINSVENDLVAKQTKQCSITDYFAKKLV